MSLSVIEDQDGVKLISFPSRQVKMICLYNLRMTDIATILDQLKQERDRIDAAIGALEGTRGGRSANGRRRGRPGRPLAAAPVGKKRRRKLSAAAKKRISEAAKARWAKAKKAGRNSL